MNTRSLVACRRSFHGAMSSNSTARRWRTALLVMANSLPPTELLRSALSHRTSLVSMTWWATFGNGQRIAPTTLIITVVDHPMVQRGSTVTIVPCVSLAAGRGTSLQATSARRLLSKRGPGTRTLDSEPRGHSLHLDRSFVRLLCLSGLAPETANSSHSRVSRSPNSVAPPRSNHPPGDRCACALVPRQPSSAPWIHDNESPSDSLRAFLKALLNSTE